MVEEVSSPSILCLAHSPAFCLYTNVYMSLGLECCLVFRMKNFKWTTGSWENENKLWQKGIATTTTTVENTGKCTWKPNEQNNYRVYVVMLELSLLLLLLLLLLILLRFFGFAWQIKVVHNICMNVCIVFFVFESQVYSIGCLCVFSHELKQYSIF